MKFSEVKTLEHLLKEYGASGGGSTVGGGGHGGNAKANKSVAGSDASKEKTTSQGGNAPDSKHTITQMKAKDVSVGSVVVNKKTGTAAKAISIVGDGNRPEALITKNADGSLEEIPKDQDVDAVQQVKGNQLIDVPEPELDASSSYMDKIKKGFSSGQDLFAGKLSNIAKRKGKKLKIKDLKGKIKKLSRKRLKEANPNLFEINFNHRSIATQAFDAPVKCGFEAETFFFSVDGEGSSQVDDMSIGDIEYQFGDLPESAYEAYQDWLYEKGQDEYLDDLITDKVNEVREDEEYLNDFIDSGGGPSSEAVERYKDNFEEEDPKEYENREEDGWEYINWVREFVEEEYEEEYIEWLRNEVAEENDLSDEAKELAEGDFSMDDWVYDNYSYMSSFLDDYGYDYSSGGGDVEGVADELMIWIRDNSEFQDFPESGDYGETNTTTGWAVERDSSIEPDEGTGAELISPVFDSPRKMLQEMKSLFDWSERNFGTNNSTGLHVTMSWQGEPDAPVDENGRREGQELNKLKMALLLGDPYLLAEFGRLRNSYTKSQYNNILKYAEGMKRGDAKSFEQFEGMLSKGIDTGKFNTIHFKDVKDRDSNNELIEFRIAGGSDYQTMYEKVVKAVVRYATVMKAGYDKDAYRKDYVKAVSRLLRKSQEVDPKKLKDYEGTVDHPVIDQAKEIVGKKDYFEVIRLLGTSVDYLQSHNELSKPNADKEWKQSIKDYKKGTGKDPSWMGEAEEDEAVTGFIQPDSIAPSKRAQSELKKAQERFSSAITILARDLADGKSRSTPNAKAVSEFRKYTKELKLNTKELERLAIGSMNDFNFNGSDKENIVRLTKGITLLFKQSIIQGQEYLTPANVDEILKKSWQFFMSDDSKDNRMQGQYTEILSKVSPTMNKVDIEDAIETIQKNVRQENEFARYMKHGSYGSQGVMTAGKITSPDAVQELIKFLEPYKGYKHPTSPQHHVNIKSDDSYESVAQMRMTQRMRDRMDHLQDLKTDDKDKYQNIVKQLSSIGNKFLTALKPINFETELGLKDNDQDGAEFLGLAYRGAGPNDRLSRWNNDLDKLTKMSDPEDDTYNFPKSYDDLVISSINLSDHYTAKNGQPRYFEKSEIKALLKERFAAIKQFLSAFDKIFQKEGFLDLKTEIKNKNQLDKRNKDFEKNIRGKSKATYNIPSHSWAYMDKEFFETISDENYDDRAAYLENHLEHFNDELNKGRKVYSIPSSHWSDVEDATSGLELIKTFEQAKNYYHTWRKSGYQKIKQAFERLYSVTFEDLQDEDRFIHLDGDHYRMLKNIGIEITHKGDSRKGVKGQSDLVADDITTNPESGEPLNRSSATMWSMNGDGAHQKQFDAFDWSLYPEKMKDIVAKVMKQDRYGSFKVALEVVLKKVLDGDVKLDIDNNNLPKGQDDRPYQNSYDKARSEFGMFDVMMQNGMQNYLARDEVNNLVAFLINDDNPYDFKQTVLTTFKKAFVYGDGPFNSFQDALAASRRSNLNNESVFKKFDKLTLEEQLLILDKSTILEKVNVDALPDNSIPYLLNKLLAEPMPAGDLGKQMEAYWALPVPQMLSDFRAIRGQGGDKADLRNVLRNYIKSQLDPSIRKQVNLVESKDDVVDKIQNLPDDDPQTDRIVQYIDGLLDDMGVGGRLKSIMTNLDDIDDTEVKRNQLKIAKMIASLEMTNLERAQLLAKWKKDELVDTDKILSGGKYSFPDVFRGYGTEGYVTEFIDDLSNVIGQGIGAGEFLLATLSSKITGIGSGKGKGDLLINGSHVELKTKTAKDARFKDYHVQPDATWSGKVEGFKLDFADIEEVANMPATGLNSAMHISLLQNPKLTSDPARKKKALRSTAGILQATNTGLNTKQINYLVKLMDAGNDAEFRQVYGKYNIMNYLNIKRSEGDLEGILFMDKKTKTMHYVRTEEEVQDLSLNVNTIYFISTNNIYPYPQIGVRS